MYNLLIFSDSLYVIIRPSVCL